MDRRAFVGALGLLTAANMGQAAAEVTSGSPDPDPRNESQERIRRAKTAAMSMQRRDWEQGILAQALLEAGDRGAVIQLTRAAIVQQTADGRMGVVVSGGPTDPAMGGAAYLQAAQWTSDPAMRRSVDALAHWIRFKAPRSADGTLYHVFGAPEMWSDGFNCAPPFLAALGLYDEAQAQIEGYRRRLWNPEARLLAHVWDDGTQTFKDGHFWGGGNGWAAAGLARVIRSLPRERQQDRDTLAAFARQIIDGCLAHQRPDGLFHDVIDQPSTFAETNLAQMLAYAMNRGLLDGWLPEAYRSKSRRLQTAARAKMDELGFVQGVCGAPKFDRPGVSTEGQAFCILMEASSAAVEQSASPRR